MIYFVVKVGINVVYTLVGTLTGYTYNTILQAFYQLAHLMLSAAKFGTHVKYGKVRLPHAAIVSRNRANGSPGAVPTSSITRRVLF